MVNTANAANAAGLLREYLPDIPGGRTTGERLQAVVGKVFFDGIGRIEQRLNRHLSDKSEANAYIRARGHSLRRDL